MAVRAQNNNNKVACFISLRQKPKTHPHYRRKTCRPTNNTQNCAWSGEEKQEIKGQERNLCTHMQQNPDFGTLVCGTTVLRHAIGKLRSSDCILYARLGGRQLYTHPHFFFFCQGTSTLQIRQQVVTVSTTSFRVLPISVTKLLGHRDAPTSQMHPSKQTKRHPRGGIDDET